MSILTPYHRVASGEGSVRCWYELIREAAGMGLLVGLLRILPLCAVLLALPAIVAAFPIAEPGTEGFELIVNSTTPVVATYQGNSATFSNDLYLMLDGPG